MKWWVSAIAIGMVFAGCNSGPCRGGVCECGDQERCEFVCSDVPCAAECTSLTDCIGTCGDRCDLTCTNASGCDFACGDDCVVECRSVSTCDVRCGAGCSVACSDLASCAVLMDSGLVTCERAGGCPIECARPDGGREPAEDCGGGLFACPVGSCPP